MSQDDDWGSDRFDDDDLDASAASQGWNVGDESADDGFVETLTVTASNRQGTVSARALLDGRVIDIAISPNVMRMTEAELADEIMLVATLARQQGRAAQHAYVAALMRHLGHDEAGTRSFLERDLGLPSPETVLKEKAAALASRPANDDE